MTAAADRRPGDGGWWRGTRLVAERALVEQLRSRSFRIVTLLLLLLSVAAVVLPQVLDDGPDTATLVTVGDAPEDLRATLDAVADTAELEVRYRSRDDAAAVRAAVRDGRADAGLAGDRLFSPSADDGSFPSLVAQAAVVTETARRLDDAGLDPAQVERITSVRPPRQVAVGPAEDSDRAGLGFLVGIVLYLALTFAGSSIATIVATEKSSRISEVLLSVVRPGQAVVGTVAAVGSVTLAQLAVLTVPLAVAVQVSDDIGLPAVSGADLVLAIAWFVLGFALYAFVFAATAAMVDKVTEVSSAIMPVTVALLVGYLVGVTVVAGDPDGAAAAVASLFPLSAPLAMPIRWASGDVPVWELVLAMALTAATAVVLARFSALVYRRALVVTGRRVRVGEVLRRSR